MQKALKAVKDKDPELLEQAQEELLEAMYTEERLAVWNWSFEILEGSGPLVVVESTLCSLFGAGASVFFEIYFSAQEWEVSQW